MSSGKKHVSHEDFVRAWQRAESIDQVVATVGTSNSNCRARAKRLREMGVHLRELSRPRQKIDVAALKKLAVETYAEACEQPRKKAPKS